MRSTTWSPPTTFDYEVAPELRRDGARRGELREAARIEVGLRSLLTAGGFGAFTDTFEDLGGLHQLPGIAVQRLMADGLRVRRRGRLEERGPRPPVQGDGERATGRDVVHGGLHLPPRSGRPARPRRAHAGDLSEPGRRPAVMRDPPAFDRRTGRSRPAGVRRRPWSRAGRGDDRPGRSPPDRGQHHRCRRSDRGVAPAPGRPGPLAAATRPADRGRGVADRRRRAPYGA